MIRRKTINGNEYYYEQKSYRDKNGKVKTEHVKYIGKYEPKISETTIRKIKTEEKFLSYPKQTPKYKEEIEKYYGFTDNPNEAGYITDNGKMLDFSGKSEVTDERTKKELSNNRPLDHREVRRFIKTDESDPDYIKIYAENTGSIRLNQSGNTYLDIYKKPNPEQFKTIRRIKEPLGVYIVDYDIKGKKGSFEAVSFIEFQRKIEEI